LPRPLELGTRVSKRNLFVSFAESDGGHSYLAMRSMLDANSIGHLLFRTTVADVLDTVIAGQANFAVVPFYNSITQWDGATVKALASGQFEVHAQMCMPVSYVLAAHKQYMNEFVERYDTPYYCSPASESYWSM
jgi:prephenate dehydratase